MLKPPIPVLLKLLLLSLPLALYAQPVAEPDGQPKRAPSAVQTPAEEPKAADQAAVQVDSLVQLDLEHQKLISRIRQGLSSLPEGVRIWIGPFLLEGGESPLGAYWRNQFSSALSSGTNRNFIILNTINPQGDYSLTGEFLRIGNILRIYTRLTKLQDASLTATWNLDVLVTPFIGELMAGYSDFSKVPPDKYEPDNMDNPVEVKIGAPRIERTIHQGDEDWFSIYMEHSGVLILETAGSMDTYMELYDADSGSELASNDDGGNGLNARIEYFADEGKTYIAKVQGLGGETGSYSFGALLKVDTNEPNDTQEQATPIELGMLIEASFHTSSDVDWYKLRIPETGGVLTLYTEGRMDTSMTLYDEEGKVLAEDDDSGYRYNARMSLQVAGGILYIRVTEMDGARGSYTLYTKLIEPGRIDAYEPDNSSETAKEIELGSSQERTFTTADDVDWVKFTVTVSGYYEIGITSADQDLDTYIELFDEEGTFIDEDDDSGDNLNPYLRIYLEPGTYFIAIYTLEDDPLDNNAYILNVSASED